MYTGRALPLNAAQMSLIIDYLNGLNEPYRTGAKIYQLAAAQR